LLRAAGERYRNVNSDRTLLCFFSRHPERSPEQANEWKKAVEKAFPNGAESVKLASFQKTPGPPTEGVKLRRFVSMRKKLGLESGNISVVALDGHRVRNLNQFNFAREWSNDVLMKLIVWDGTAWKEVPVRRWDVVIFADPLVPKKGP
jgi:hypothetical protein